MNEKDYYNLIDLRDAYCVIERESHGVSNFGKIQEFFTIVAMIPSKNEVRIKYTNFSVIGQHYCNTHNRASKEEHINDIVTFLQLIQSVGVVADGMIKQPTIFGFPYGKDLPLEKLLIEMVFPSELFESGAKLIFTKKF